MNIYEKRYFARVGIFALFWFALAHPQEARAQSATERGQAALSWLESFRCPTPGDLLQPKGLTNATEIASVRKQNWDYANSRTAARAEVIRARNAALVSSSGSPGDVQAGTKLSDAFLQLDASISEQDYQVAAALARWALTQFVQISQARSDYQVLSGESNPLVPVSKDLLELDKLLEQFGPPPQPVAAKLRKCLIEANDIYLNQSAPFVRERVAKFSSLAEYDALLEVLSRVPFDPEQPGGKVVTDISLRREAFFQEQQRAAEIARAASNAKERERLIEAAKETQRVARAFVEALSRGDTQGASAFLAEDVSMTSPNGPATGKDAVLKRMQQAASKGAESSISSPEIGGDYTVFSIVRASKGSGRMSFFSKNQRLTRISIDQ